jgi:hypothetical protein
MSEQRIAATIRVFIVVISGFYRRERLLSGRPRLTVFEGPNSLQTSIQGFLRKLEGEGSKYFAVLDRGLRTKRSVLAADFHREPAFVIDPKHLSRDKVKTRKTAFNIAIWRYVSPL